MASKETKQSRLEQEIKALSAEEQEAVEDILLRLRDAGIAPKPDWSLRDVAELYSDYMEIAGAVGRTTQRWGEEAMTPAEVPGRGKNKNAGQYAGEGFLHSSHIPSTRTYTPEEPVSDKPAAQRGRHPKVPVEPASDAPVGEHLLYWREKARLKPAEVVNQASCVLLNRYETNEITPPRPHLDALMEALSVPEEAREHMRTLQEAARQAAAPSPDASLGEHLRYWRGQAALTQKQVHEKLQGYSISDNETNRSVPSYHRLEAMMDIIAVPEEERPHLRTLRRSAERRADMANVPEPARDAPAGTHLFYWREKAGLTQKALSTKISRSENIIHFYETGHITPPQPVLEKLMDACAVPEEKRPHLRTICTPVKVPPPLPAPLQEDASFGDHLRYWRQTAHLSQRNLAAEFGISENAIGNYEKNRELLPREFLDIFVDICAVPEQNRQHLYDLHEQRKAPAALAEDASLGEHLVYWRKKAAFTQTEAEGFLNFTVIHQYELDKVTPPAEKLESIMTLYKVPEDARDTLRELRKQRKMSPAPGEDAVLGDHIRYWREQAGLYQHEADKKPGLSKLAYFETGKKIPNAERLEFVMDALDVPENMREKMRELRNATKPTPQLQEGNADISGRPSGKQRGEY